MNDDGFYGVVFEKKHGGYTLHNTNIPVYQQGYKKFSEKECDHNSASLGFALELRPILNIDCLFFQLGWLGEQELRNRTRHCGFGGRMLRPATETTET